MFYHATLFAEMWWGEKASMWAAGRINTFGEKCRLAVRAVRLILQSLEVEREEEDENDLQLGKTSCPFIVAHKTSWSRAATLFAYILNDCARKVTHLFFSHSVNTYATQYEKRLLCNIMFLLWIFWWCLCPDLFCVIYTVFLKASVV